MSLRADTFGGQLLHFARSVDIVSDATMESVRNLVSRYVNNWFGAQHFEFMRERQYHDDDAVRLTTRWSSTTGVERVWTIRTDGAYTNPVTMSFDTNQPLSLVAADKCPLNEATTCVDKWSNVNDVPPYRPVTRDPQIHTLITVPVHYRRKLGIYYFETTRYINPAKVAKEEFTALADALGILLELWYVCRGQSDATKNALNELTDLLNLARFPKLAKPHVFLAYSGRADDAVMRVIKCVLDDFSDKLEYTDWKASHHTGSISAQISRNIAESPFGICYLSEPVEPAGTAGSAFVDNPNVLFEAGMLHARSGASVDAGEPARWIAIREEASSSAPFDIAGNRFLFVPRDESGRLHGEQLRELLTGSLCALLKEPSRREAPLAGG